MCTYRIYVLDRAWQLIYLPLSLTLTFTFAHYRSSWLLMFWGIIFPVKQRHRYAFSNKRWEANQVSGSTWCGLNAIPCNCHVYCLGVAFMELLNWIWNLSEVCVNLLKFETFPATLLTSFSGVLNATMLHYV